MNIKRIVVIALFAMQPVVAPRGGGLSSPPAQPVLAMNPLEAMDEGWFTGPLVAPNPNPVAPGHFCAEPYFIDSIKYGDMMESGIPTART
jgi:hypothetical protein